MAKRGGDSGHGERRGRLRTILALVVLASAWASLGSSQPSEPPGTIEFVARNALAEANGSFRSWRVTRADIDRADIGASVVEIEVDVASIDTGIGLRDTHLRSADFFEVERWPLARVRVHGARAAGRSERGHPRYTALFELRIRDQQKTLEGEFELIGEDRVEGTLSIDRTDWGVGSPRSRWNPLSVHDEVEVRYGAELPQR